MLAEHEKRALKDKIRSNQHEVFIVSLEEMDAIVRSSNKSSVKEKWQEIRGAAEFGASYYASADDLVLLSKLVGDLGGIGAQVYVKNYGGKPHIILKGRPGLRKILTGTRYGIKNQKVVTMGLGKHGAIHAARQGGIVSIVLISVYRVVDYFLTDKATLSRLFGTLATDIVKVGIAVGASIAAAAAIGGTTIAIGPLAVVILVGFFTSMALNSLDKHYGITDSVVASLDRLVMLGRLASSYKTMKIDEGRANVRANLESRKRQLKNAVDESIDSVIDYTVDSAKKIAIKLSRDFFRKLLPRSPGIY